MPDGDNQKYTPKLLNAGRPVAARFREPTFSILASQLWLVNVQLTTVAGAAIIAKTAVAPFERVKARLFHLTANLLVLPALVPVAKHLLCPVGDHCHRQQNDDSVTYAAASTSQH